MPGIMEIQSLLNNNKIMIKCLRIVAKPIIKEVMGAH
jgi:hypothetical protein